MKNCKHSFLYFAFMAITVVACKETDIDNEHHFDNKVYVNTQSLFDDLLIRNDVTDYSREISCRLPMPADKDIQVKFEAAPYMTAAYNLVYGDDATALDARYYNIPEKTSTIKAGEVSGNNIVVNFMNTAELDNSRRYVLPVTIENATDIGIVESKRTTYFVFKGAALINVVANIKNCYFPINWKSDVSNLSTITVEALVRSSDWTAGRDNALSSIFGIEGEFLIRIGDGDRPRDQLQLDAPGGKFPNPNAVQGLPVNEWTHIAIVYDAEKGERIYYLNGKEVASDGSASKPISLTSNCYIGKSYNDSRWLPGEIAELRIWKVQRTAGQIAKNPYSVNPNTEGLLAYWKFNEGAGNIAKDYTGHGNDITASGGNPVWINVEIPKVN